MILKTEQDMNCLRLKSARVEARFDSFSYFICVVIRSDQETST